MAMTIGAAITELRKKMGLNQTQFGKLFRTTAMSVSRWERDENAPKARDLLTLGIMAKTAGLNGWFYWRRAGVTPMYAQAIDNPYRKLRPKARRLSVT